MAVLSQCLKFQSIKQYLNIVRLLHLEAGIPNPLLDNWYIRSVLTGVKRVLGDSTSPKLPITPEILKAIRTKLNLQSPFDSIFWSATLTGFFAFLRKSNLFYPAGGFDKNKHLLRSDFSLCNTGMVIKIKWSKTIQFSQRFFQVVIPRIPGNPLCPVAAIQDAFCLAPNLPDDPAFSWRVGTSRTCMTYSKYISALRGHLGSCGFSPSAYAGHSLRRGGASWAFRCGVPGELIKQQGDWKSEAYHRYLELPLEDKGYMALSMSKYL